MSVPGGGQVSVDRRGPVEPSARVTFHDDDWILGDGESLSFGRQSSCPLRVGAPDAHGPEDLGVSRQAGTLIHAQGSVWVRNDSTTQPLYVHSPIRGEQVLESRGDMLALAEPQLEL